MTHKPPLGFVPLNSLTGEPRDPASLLAEIRRIYFRTTRRTIQNDLAHAVELLKSLPSEDDREKATVYMDGLAQMYRQWRKEGTADQGAGTGDRESGTAGRKGAGRKGKKPTPR